MDRIAATVISTKNSITAALISLTDTAMLIRDYVIITTGLRIIPFAISVIDLPTRGVGTVAAMVGIVMDADPWLPLEAWRRRMVTGDLISG